MKMKTRMLTVLAALAALKTAVSARRAKEYRYVSLEVGTEGAAQRRPKTIKIGTLAVAVAVLAVLGFAGAAAFVYFGVYNVAATQQHSAPMYHLLHYAMRRSVDARSADVKVPDLADLGRTSKGFALYRGYCVQCHGAPGVEPDPVGLGTRPEPANLVEAAREWRATEIYWVVKPGLKKTDMPAWEYRMSEDQLWDLVAFVKLLPSLSPKQYQDWDKEQPPAKPEQPPTLPADARLSASAAASGKALGDAKAGRHAIEQYLCITCHRIPGVTGADKTVGPPLNGIATRKYIGGVLVNTPENMMHWLRDPKQIDPLSGMPNLHIKEKDLRDIAAYLYTLDKP